MKGSLDCRLRHGGEERLGKRKLARPFDRRRPMQLSLRSGRARGAWSLLHPRNCRRVESLVRSTALKWNIRLFHYVNTGIQLHFLLQAKEKAALQGFLRELPGRIAMKVTGACKGQPRGRFWSRTAWTRLIHWGGQFRRVRNYLEAATPAQGLVYRMDPTPE